MASVRQVINLALRKLGKLGAGREARPADAADALEALQAMYLAWVASGAFGRLHDIQPDGPEYVARCGQRVTRESASLVEVILPEQAVERPVYDYGRCFPGYEAPWDGAAVVIVSLDTGLTQTWIYDGTLKAWQQVDAIQMDDEAPRSSDRNGLAACLAIEFADQYGGDVPAATVQQASRYKMALTAGYGFQRKPQALGVYI